ncbi:Peroxyureidoacrylate/ureidoacrylate amidohydrolase RutB [Pseudocercospora fuligena]|uniref:Peroxyureidoacrylate/ureidoacrylate amidohydrolase RutB n=1 Tax=Pseudocercospora fuligena TaxID=685502 RepID=A0A8H6VGB8_9PEZI|nr:Peroxyureidoacrylate/ureidoacrylate amidohydrolase RutB [Pseudocercospora fuligena]
MQDKGHQVNAEPYAWPHDGQLDAQTTALVVIDMQRDFCEEGGYLSQQGYDIGNTRAIIPNIKRLLASCRTEGFPIFYTREGHRADLSDLSTRELFRSRNNPSGLGIGDEGPLGRLLVHGEAGHDIIKELYPQQGEPVVDKPGKGAFTNTDFDLLLRVKNIRNLIICGVTTDVCVHATIRQANDRGLDCLLIGDCCAASEEHLHRAAVEMVRTEGGVFGATANVDDILKAIEG